MIVDLMKKVSELDQVIARTSDPEKRRALIEKALREMGRDAYQQGYTKGCKDSTGERQ